MILALRHRELARLCDTFDTLPTAAPTCCDGWVELTRSVYGRPTDVDIEASA